MKHGLLCKRQHAARSKVITANSHATLRKLVGVESQQV
jgi:hypothetical protein